MPKIGFTQQKIIIIDKEIIGTNHFKLDIPNNKKVEANEPIQADLEFVRSIQINNPNKINLLILL